MYQLAYMHFQSLWLLCTLQPPRLDRYNLNRLLENFPSRFSLSGLPKTLQIGLVATFDNEDGGKDTSSQAV